MEKIKSKPGRKKGSPNKNNKYELLNYNFIDNQWVKINDFATLINIAEVLNLSYCIIVDIAKDKHPLLNKFFKINKMA